jgi:hypothetical protein
MFQKGLAMCKNVSKGNFVGKRLLMNPDNRTMSFFPDTDPKMLSAKTNEIPKPRTHYRVTEAYSDGTVMTNMLSRHQNAPEVYFFLWDMKKDPPGFLARGTYSVNNLDYDVKLVGQYLILVPMFPKDAGAIVRVLNPFRYTLKLQFYCGF